MPALFYLPKVATLPGAKLYFYQTNTSTPQAVYTNEALSVAHSQPVVADANGVVAPIYLNPTLPSYRVTLTTSADVLIYTVDDVPSNQNTTTGFRIEDTTPDVVFYDTDGTSGQRKFRIRASGNAFEIQTLNDAENTATTHLAIEGGVTQRLVLNDTATVDSSGTEYQVAFNQAGTFTGTLTGCTTSPTATLRYTKIGSLVTLFIPSAGDGLTGTSNATSMTITGMPAAIRPTRTQFCATISCGDNSNLIGDGESVGIQIGTDGVITFLINGSTTGFTGSGTKGTGPGCTVNYFTA